jgi:hypothetical protein
MRSTCAKPPVPARGIPTGNSTPFNEEELRNERWLQIAGLEGRYEISDLGRVKSLARLCPTRPGVLRRVRERILLFSSHPKGYDVTILSDDSGNRRGMTVHRAVWLAFVGAIPAGMELDHKDFDKHNNRLTNLRVLTPAENTMSAIRAGRNKVFRGESNGGAKLKEMDVLQIRLLREQGFSLRQLAARFGCSTYTVYGIIRGRSWKHVPKNDKAAVATGDLV